MGASKVSSGKNIPHEINVIIEIPMLSQPVKYEMNKNTEMLHVDRFLATAMFYPANYGYMPQTLSDDGDPVDVLVVTPLPLIPGSVIACRPVGMLNMTDESGTDEKILAVPVSKLTPLYEKVISHDDLPASLLASISHFFTHYKALEAGKWTKIDGWSGPDAAKKAIEQAVSHFKVPA